jgi:hypothetical protein
MTTRRSRKDISQDPSYRRLREFKASVMTPELKASFDAHAVGIGRKIVNGRATDQLALRVYVTAKRPLAQLSPEEEVPEEFTFRSLGEEDEVAIATDVIETPPAVFEVDPTDRIRPAPGGVSVDAISGTAGTLGGWVWDETDDTIVALSNHHIFGHAMGTDTIQPGPTDGGSSPADKIGDVKRGIPRSAVSTNTVDCAISDADSSDIYDLQVLDIGPAVYATRVATLDMLVEKFGRTTEHTFGIIEDADYEPTVGGFPFDDCLRIEVVDPSPDWSAGGDSGSLVFAQEPISPGSAIKGVVGLHFGGPLGGTYGIACKIQNVFAQLDLTNLCAGAFSAFLESLFEAAEAREEEVAGTTPRAAAMVPAGTPTLLAPPAFVRRERRWRRGRKLHRGIAREIQRRLQTTERGRLLTDLVDVHRAELLTLLVTDGDVRRATIVALEPILAGAVTTSDVFDRVLDGRDLEQIDRLVREVSRKAGPKLRDALKPLVELRQKAQGKRLAQVFGIRERRGAGVSA